MSKILFICKRRSYGISYGLINSCEFICNVLRKHKIHCKVVTINDNNDIDREVAEYEPTHVVIEALWVVPSKFEELCDLHPDVEWIVRLHSKAPFLSTEGIATEWIEEYIELEDDGYNVHVAVNNKEFQEDLEDVYQAGFLYLPNIYSPSHKSESSADHIQSDSEISIGCFGAIRQQKNQFQQAIAAIRFANSMEKTLIFHMNSSKIETKDSGILKNIQNLFDATSHKLVLHDWMPHSEFIELVKTMDLGMQISFSESFCIICSDFVFNDIPVIVSHDVTWMPHMFQVETTDTNAIIRKLEFAYGTEWLGVSHFAKKNLKKHNEESKDIWLDTFYNEEEA